MRARRLLFPCASVVLLLAIPCVAFVFWTSQAFTVELPWMRWAFLAAAALLLLMLRPTLGVVVIDERGVRVRTLRPLTNLSQRSLFLKNPKKPKGKGSLHVEYKHINTTRKKIRR